MEKGVYGDAFSVPFILSWFFQVENKFFSITWISYSFQIYSSHKTKTKFLKFFVAF